MKKADWTDRMLAVLVELYPVETTAYTAAVLNLSESTVKLKARELGLHIPADTRSAFPVISVQSPVSIQCCWQS